MLPSEMQEARPGSAQRPLTLRHSGCSCRGLRAAVTLGAITVFRPKGTPHE